MADDEVLAILRDRGMNLTLDDLVTVKTMALELEPEASAWIDEAVALIVNDPLYKGDIKPLA